MRRPASALRRVLGLLGPSWAASPWRRTVQTACLAAFLVLTLHVAWPYGEGRDYSATRSAREVVEAEVFLALDPLAGAAAALAARAWVWALPFAAATVLLGLLFPRAFCGWVCPLGTLIDACDATVGRRAGRLNLRRRGWWVHLRWFLLAAVLAGAAGGVMLAGWAAAIPLLTRGIVFSAKPLLTGLLRGGHLVPEIGAPHGISAVLVLSVLALTVLGRRFWCRCLCPTGALLSLVGRRTAFSRHVDENCSQCGRCVEACAFDAIDERHATRAGACAYCRTCGAACPPGAIRYGPGAPVLAPAAAPLIGRRSILAVGLAAASAALALPRFSRAAFRDPAREPFVRPPGSLPERDFLAACVRCGLCVMACPNDVLQPVGLADGLEGYFAPRVVADFAGCEPTCNNCGQVCPTGAVRALALAEKRAARMGLAEIDPGLCLPHAGREECRLCADECDAAGYEAIEFVRVRTEMDETGAPVEGSGFLAPVVVAWRCNGCGLCQMRCHRVNALEKRLLPATAVRVRAGEGREDRIAGGSYIALRAAEAKEREERLAAENRLRGAGDEYLPDFLRDR